MSIFRGIQPIKENGNDFVIIRLPGKTQDIAQYIQAITYALQSLTVRADEEIEAVALYWLVNILEALQFNDSQMAAIEYKMDDELSKIGEKPVDRDYL